MIDIDNELWYRIPQLAAEFAANTRPRLTALTKRAAAAVLQTSVPFFWHDPDMDEVRPGTSLPPDYGQRPWMPIKTAEATVQDIVKPLGQALHLTPSSFSSLYGGPTPIAATLAGGLLGAGMGYLGGTAAEQLLPEGVFNRGRLRKTLAVLGGAAGAAPGLYLGFRGMGNDVRQGQGSSWRSWTEPNFLFGRGQPETEAQRQLLSDTLSQHLKSGEVADHVKKAAFDAGSALFSPDIPVDQFNRVIWADPMTPQPLRAAASGLLEAASQNAGGLRLISPFDVAQIAIGAGSGMVSGMLVGRVLGALAGLSYPAQKKLQEVGTWAGVISNIVPMAFGL